MDATLDKLIGQFRAAQDMAVTVLTERLRIPRPQTAREWVFFCSTHKLNHRYTLQDVDVYTHGYGIELKIGGLVVDFDWGENGEPDGFDAWRLYNFAVENKLPVSATHGAIQNQLDPAVVAGELLKTKTLYYDPNRRSSKI